MTDAPQKAVVHASPVSTPASAADFTPKFDTSKTSHSLKDATKTTSDKTSGASACIVLKDPGICTTAESSTFFNTMLPSVVSGVLVVVGWYVVNKAQANRERRKQIREYVTDLATDLDDIETLAIDYHTQERDVAKEHELISKLGRFEKACSILPRFLDRQTFFKAVSPEKLNIDGERLQQLRKAMTLRHFADEHTAAIVANDDLIQELGLAAGEMQEVLKSVLIEALD